MFLNADALIAGVLIGLALAVPIGPVNLIVIRSVLGRGLAAGVMAGAGALAGDTLFAAVAAFGVGAVQELVLKHAMPLQLAGGLLLIVIGVRTVLAHVTEAALRAEAAPGGVIVLVSTFVLTITNPAALMGMAAMAGAAGAALGLAGQPLRTGILVLGVAAGSGMWWLTLSSIALRLKDRLTAAALDRISHASGVVIALFGVAVIARAVFF